MGEYDHSLQGEQDPDHLNDIMALGMHKFDYFYKIKIVAIGCI